MGKFLKILLLFIPLASCTPNSGSPIHIYEYEDVIDKEISYLDAFNVDSKYYYLYYYQVDCYYCHGIKSKVINFALQSSNPFYFIKIDGDYGFLSHSKEETIGTNNPLKSFSMMTPQLSIVENGYIVDTYIGVDEILNIIE